MSVFGLRFAIGNETDFFIVVALSGALGGSVHTLRSMTWYFGNGNLRHR